MKKALNILFVIVVACGLFLVNANSPVSAKSNNASPAEGSWSTGEEININLEKYPAPYDWYQLLEKGVKIEHASEICHPFRGGHYHWIGDIRELVNGKWVKVPTEQGWLNGEEAGYMVCGKAPAAGTYALFGYYAGPSETVSQLPNYHAEWGECGFGEIDPIPPFTVASQGWMISGLTADTQHLYVKIQNTEATSDLSGQVTYLFTGMNPSGLVLTGLSGSSSVTDDSGNWLVSFGENISFGSFPSEWNFSIRVEFVEEKCHINLYMDDSFFS